MKFIFGFLYITACSVSIAFAGVDDTSSRTCSIKYPILNRKVPDEIRVMEIDTGIDGNHLALKSNVQNDESTDYVDSHGHGTHVAGIILYGNLTLETEMGFHPKFKTQDLVCPEVKLFSCKYYDPSGPHINNMNKEIECVKKALVNKIDVINFSGGGVDAEKDEYRAYKSFVDSGGFVVTAIGNEQSNIEINPYYPAAYSNQVTKTLFWGLLDPIEKLNNFFFVEAIDSHGKVLPSSNYNSRAIKEIGIGVISTFPNNSFGSLTGSSMSAPAYLHKILKYNCEILHGEAQWN